MRTTFYILITLLTFGFSDVYACSCQGESTIKGAIKSSDYVVVGEIISKNYIDIPDSVLISQYPTDTFVHNYYPYVHKISKFEIKVERIFKGKITSDTLVIYTGNGGGDCGYRFEIGGKYIVYGMKETYFGLANNDYCYPKGENFLWTNICMRTSDYYDSEIIAIKKELKIKK